MYAKNLFGLNKDGSFKVWNIEVREYVCPVDQIPTASVTIHHGKEGGVLTMDQKFHQTGKQGRTVGEQAELDAKARVKKQMDKGYRETKAELGELPVLAMLASDATKVGHRIKYDKGVFLSDKFDGCRLMAKCESLGVVKLYSRTGQEFDIPHISDMLIRYMNPGEIWDGEVYKHGHELQDILSAVKRTDTKKEIDKANRKVLKYGTEYRKENGMPTAGEELVSAVNIHMLRPQLEFHIFDVYVENMVFADRLEELSKLFEYRIGANKVVKAVKYKLVHSEAEMLAEHKDCVSRGYEGVMIRNWDGIYESGKRSGDLFKYKTFFDSEFEILNIVPDSEGHGVFVLQNDLTQETFSCVMGTMEQRDRYLTQKSEYVGRFLTVKYQTRYKGTLLPQFPTGVTIRDGEVINGKFVPSI